MSKPSLSLLVANVAVVLTVVVLLVSSALS